MNLIFFGFKNCGKTTLGKKLAHRLNLPFIDTDYLIEQHYLAISGIQLNCREIFKTIGEKAFRELETSVLEQLKGAKHTIIAVGGGCVLSPKNVAFLAKLGQLVYLKVSKETLKKRTLVRATLPAYLDANNPEASFDKMYNERKKIYEKIPAVSIDLESKTEDQVILELCTLIQSSEANNGE
jgi:shikimate kinase